MTNSYNNLNLYEILEIDEFATQDIIKKAYKRLSLKYHPDKINKLDINFDEQDINEKFIKIKYAYDILIDPIEKKRYDLSKKNIFFNESNIEMLDLKMILEEIKYFFNNKEFIIFIKIAEKKIYNSILSFNKTKDNYLIDFMDKIKDYNIITLIYNINTFKILDIELEIDFTIYELYNNISKEIKYSRISKDIFEEHIYPIDRVQTYETEGEVIILESSGVIEGNMIISINIVNNKHNDIEYHLINNDIYINIDKSKIEDNKIRLKYLDNNKYVFNLDNIEKSKTEFGYIYNIENMGLPYYDTQDNIIDFKECLICRGILYIIVLL